MAEEKLYLFRPTSKDIKIEYPELAKEPSINVLTLTEFRFVWYYGNRTSPFFTSTTGEINKIKACIKQSFSIASGNRPLERKEYERYLNGTFPSKIKEAITVMNAYNPTARLRAKIAVENIFNNLQASLEVTDDMRKQMEEDLDLKKKYIELSIKVSESLPLIIAQLEEGYGIRTSSFFGDNGKGMSVMDLLHTADSGNS